MQYNAAQFNEARKLNVTKSIAKVAAVPRAQVSLVNVSEVSDRRAAHGGKSSKFDVLVKTSNEADATSIAGKLTAAQINDALKSYGLTEATILASAAVEVLKSNSKLTSVAAPSNPHVGHVAFVALFALGMAHF